MSKLPLQGTVHNGPAARNQPVFPVMCRVLKGWSRPGDT
jgi:hypothetical protein